MADRIYEERETSTRVKGSVGTLQNNIKSLRTSGKVVYSEYLLGDGYANLKTQNPFVAFSSNILFREFIILNIFHNLIVTPNLHIKIKPTTDF